MKSALIWGCITAAALGILIGAIAGAHELMSLYGYFSIGAVAISIVLSGALLGGDRLRANYHTEEYESRQKRNGYMNKLLLFALPYALVAITIYVLN